MLGRIVSGLLTRSTPASSAAEETRTPFARALSELKAEHGLSFSELTRATEARDPTGRGLSAGHLSRLCNAIDLPSPATMALLAESFGLSPRYFAEYRLAEARAAFDERGPDGLGALDRLRSVECHLPRAPQVRSQQRPRQSP
jgi:transcriptional regulator with XRE-family HTH domain